MTLTADAADSVKARGFFDAEAVEFQFCDPVAMALAWRLVEESAEYERCRYFQRPADDQARELADVYIACSSTAQRLEIDLDPRPDLPPVPPLGPLDACGKLARSLRGSRLDTAAALGQIIAYCWREAERLGIDLEAVIRAKLAADERRGYRHNGS